MFEEKNFDGEVLRETEKVYKSLFFKENAYQASFEVLRFVGYKYKKGQVTKMRKKWNSTEFAKKAREEGFEVKQGSIDSQGKSKITIK